MKRITGHPMARFIFILVLALGSLACSTGRKVPAGTPSVARDSRDSTEYEIIINDPGFEKWYITNYSPAKDYPQEYYRGRNIMGVANWNEYYRSGRFTRIILNEIDYQPQIDYGIEVNRKLFWYFKYIEETDRINLMW